MAHMLITLVTSGKEFALEGNLSERVHRGLKDWDVTFHLNDQEAVDVLSAIHGNDADYVTIRLSDGRSGKALATRNAMRSDVRFGNSATIELKGSGPLERE